MKRQNLSLRKLETLEVSRRSATADPYVIFNFYSLLQQEMDRLDLHDKPSHIWNLDESFLPSDPTRMLCVTGKGQSAHRNIMGSGKDNTSFLACCSAAGKLMPPLIIFEGTHL